MMDFKEATLSHLKRSDLSSYLLQYPVLLTNSHSVGIDTNLAKEILHPLALGHIFEGVAQKFHQSYIDEYIHLLGRITAPVITTAVQEVGHKKRLMAYSRYGEDATQHMINKVAWEALNKSFNVSGATCETVKTNIFDPLPILWPRDPCFIVDNVAFFPDPLLMQAYRGAYMLEEHQNAYYKMREFLKNKGLKIVTVEGCYFEGGNLVPDDKGGFLFYGQRFDHREENMTPLCQAIERETGRRWKPVAIPTDPMMYPHLALGMSPELPNGKFMVARSLGPDRNCQGYHEFVKHIGPDRVIPIDSKYDSLSPLIANAVVMGNGVMMPCCPDDIRQELTEDGVIVNSPTAEDIAGTVYKFSGPQAVRVIGKGGPHCLSNEYELEID